MWGWQRSCWGSMWKDEQFSRSEGHGGRSCWRFCARKMITGFLGGRKSFLGVLGTKVLDSQVEMRFWSGDEVLEEGQVLVWSGGGGGGRGARYRVVQSPCVHFSQRFCRNGIFQGNPGGITPHLPEEVTPSRGRWRSSSHLAEGPPLLLGVSVAAPKLGPWGPTRALVVAPSSRGRRRRALRWRLQQPHPGASRSFSSTAGLWWGVMVLQALGTGTQKVPWAHQGTFPQCSHFPREHRHFFRLCLIPETKFLAPSAPSPWESTSAAEPPVQPPSFGGSPSVTPSVRVKFPQWSRL